VRRQRSLDAHAIIEELELAINVGFDALCLCECARRGQQGRLVADEVVDEVPGEPLFRPRSVRRVVERGDRVQLVEMLDAGRGIVEDGLVGYLEVAELCMPFDCQLDSCDTLCTPCA
jgi:hypothetical protein